MSSINLKMALMKASQDKAADNPDDPLAFMLTDAEIQEVKDQVADFEDNQ